MRVRGAEGDRYWEPFNREHRRRYSVSRNLVTEARRGQHRGNRLVWFEILDRTMQVCSHGSHAQIAVFEYELASRFARRPTQEVEQ